MLRNLVVPFSLALLVGCAHQEVKPTPAPVAKSAAGAPAPVVAETPRPGEPAAPLEVKPTLDPIHFDFDKSDIHPEDTNILVALGNYLLEHKDRFLTIAGHCDERGTVEYNIAFGDRRASVARDYLVRLGVDFNRIRTISYGEAIPADSGHDETAWAKNRRDEFQV